MNADEDAILLCIRDTSAQFQWNKDVALARHHDFETFRLEQWSQLTCDIQRIIFFAAVTTARAFIVTAVARIEDDRVHVTKILNHVRTQLRLQSFREIDARNEKFAVS